MINRVVLTGRLTKDPEMKYTQSGIAVTRFTLAVNRTFKNNNGEQEADFINCVAWRKQAENVANFLSKGSLIGVDGRIQTSSFDGQDGKRIFMTDIVAESIQFLDSKNAQDSSQGVNSSQASNSSQNKKNARSYKGEPNYNTSNYGGGNVEVQDDDLPF